jgi:hypothetical protein
MTTQHLYVATPAYGCMMHTAFVSSILQLQGACIGRGIEFSVDMIGNESLVQRARNILQARFLKSKATHLLFIDADIAFSPEAVLDRLLKADKDVIGGVYAKKSIDWTVARTRLLTEGSQETPQSAGLDYNINVAPGENPVVDGVCEVLDTATGFLLIKRHVIEEMWKHYAEELWCKNDIQGSTNIDSYCAIFDCMIDETRRYLSEDYAFCRRWQQMGGKIHADIAFPLAHIGSHTFAGDVRERFTLQYTAT